MAKGLLGDSCTVYFVGRSPLAYYEHRIEERTTPPFGSKYFFFRSQILEGHAEIRRDDTMVDNCAWVTKEEARERLTDAYFGAVEPMLSD